MVYSIQDLLYLWQGYGLFDYLFPFLLIFAVVFGILTQMNIFGKNKAVNVIIALVVGVMAVRFGWFTQFYSELFPRIGIGIVIMLSILIVIGLFIEKEYVRYWYYGLSTIAAIIALVAIYQSFDVLGWGYGTFNSDLIGWVILGALFLGIIIAVANASGEKDSKGKPAGAFIIPGIDYERR